MRAAARCLALALAAARDVAVPGPAFTDCVGRGAEPAEGQATVFWSEADHFVDGAERQHAAAALLLRHGAHDANGTVVDVGAGRGGLRRFLPPATAYVAADVTGYGIGAVLCDVNRLEFPFLLAPGEARDGVAAFAFLGSFEYVLDKQTVLRLCRMHRGAHAVFAYHSPTARFEWVAPLSFRAFAEAARIAGFDASFFAEPEAAPVDWLGAEKHDRAGGTGFAYAYLTPAGAPARLRSVSVEALAGPREAEDPAAVHLRAGRQPCVYELDPEGEEVVRTDVTREACLWASGIDVVDSRLRAVHWRAGCRAAANPTSLAPHRFRKLRVENR
ncbi:hypothetical protein AURANDRAFT_67753 [Aureococcus anophagefferens]|uniref:Methyltransferase type 11 domain-containing protein n=1 Tax=Aureococcus anophagefferens TaxID=44056 RepID=F0YMA3_AURAN|nr:hypothetical protein AURANDRAFT_67753 [Aureococcus anophagefferens]EGB03767.1 hypothetical protein AURANDRAFT_67753 [Aureococcus anophagefferens]|eukprot:XP_009041552.1 hypothetical protein AURANDRAFT_67753 [Aureococcus anophagefferens]